MEFGITTIDDLPEGILIHIISFLPTNYAVRTTAISRRWCNLWHSVPNLHFSPFEFPAYVSDKCLRDARQLFAEFISQTILHRPRHSPLEKFYLFFNYKNYDSIRAYVNSWVRFVVSSKATELELDFEAHLSWFPLFRDKNENRVDYATENADQGEENSEINAGYDFPFSDLINSSLKVLKLHGCDFCLPEIALGMKFDSIREIHLQQFYSIEGEIENLMALCVNVEFLSLDCIHFLQSFKVVSPKLKNLKLGHFGGRNTAQNSVEICAPSLESVSFDSFFAGKYTMEDTSSLVEAYVDFGSRSWWDFVCWTNVVSLLSGVERLTIQNMRIWSVKEYIDRNDEEVKKQAEVESKNESVIWNDKFHGKLKLGEEVFSKTFAFNNLKSLELLTGYSRSDILGLKFLLQKSPKLETMVLHLQYSYQSDPDEDLGKEMTERRTALQIPCLRLVKMKNYKGSKNELFLVGLIKKHRVVLEKIVAFPAKVGETSSPPFVL